MKKEVKNIFNQSYEQHESKVDPASIWEAVELQKGKKKRRGFIWWFVGPSILVLSLLAYQFFGEGNITETTTSEIVENGQQVMSSLSAIEEVTLVEEIEQKEEMAGSKNKTPEANINNVIKRNKLNQKLKPAFKEVETSNTQNNLEALGNNFNVKDINQLQQPSDRRVNGQVNAITNDGNSEINTPVDLVTEIETAVVIEEKLYDNTSFSVLEAMEKLKVLEQGVVTSENIKTESSQKKMVDFEDVSKPEEKADSRTKFNLTVLGAAGLFSDKFIDADPDSLASRIESESTLESFSSEILVGIQFGKIGLETGVNYHRSNRVMEWSSEYFGDIDGRLLYPHDPNRINPSLLVSGAAGDSSQIFYYKHTLRKYNETHTVSIPLIINYTHSFKSLDLGLYGGAAFNLMQVNNNDVLSHNGNLIDQRKDLFISRRPDWMAGTFLDYKLNENISLTSRVGFRFRKTQENKLAVQTNFYTLGLGLKFHLN